MKLEFHNKKITGLLTVLPKREVKFDDEMGNYNFSVSKSMKLKAAMGFESRRVVDEKTCVSDLCINGLEYLFSNDLLKKEEIDALILVSQSFDYLMPPTSNLIQGHFELKQDMICLDISQGCAGFLIGIIQAFMLLEQPAIRKVVLLNADVLSRKTSKRDRNSNPLIGDGASIAIIENSTDAKVVYANIKMDGSGANALMIPAGGFKLPSSIETGIMTEDSAGNWRSDDHLVMKGDEVFNFVQREVPPMIEDLLEYAKIEKSAIDYFMFHQPNRFMLHKLADKLNVPREKMPSNIVENFGNSSGVSIPTAITFTLGEKLERDSYQICLAGFGVGLTWSSMLIEMQRLSFCKMIYY